MLNRSYCSSITKYGSNCVKYTSILQLTKDRTATLRNTHSHICTEILFVPYNENRRPYICTLLVLRNKVEVETIECVLYEYFQIVVQHTVPLLGRPISSDQGASE